MFLRRGPRQFLISIHAPREGGDISKTAHNIADMGFQSTPPARGATSIFARCTIIWSFQSTPPARGATKRKTQTISTLIISIHAPREGGDSSTCNPPNDRPFQSTPPARGATITDFILVPRNRIFQSTPPARGATAKMHSFICESLTNK